MHVNNFRKESGRVMKLSIATLMGVLQSGPASASSAGASYGSRGKREVFLRAFLVVLCLLEGRVYLELDGLEISGNLCRFLSH